MRILITNDDGIYSPGLLALAEAAVRFGEVRIVAPDIEQSSMGHAITSSRPLSWRRAAIGEFDAYRVNGTPADCVALGASQWRKPGTTGDTDGGVDVVLSGINLGPNLGNAMWHSGTLAAAKQAALLGLRGVALSTPVVDDKPSFELLKPYLHDVLDLLLYTETHLKLVNVNFPSKPQGVLWTRQGVRHYDGYVVPGKDPAGRKHFWYLVRPIEQVEEGTDLWAARHGFVSITPLRLDLTDHAELASVKDRHPDLATPAAAPLSQPEALEEVPESASDAIHQD